MNACPLPSPGRLAAVFFALVWGWLFWVVTTWPITITVTVLLSVAGCFLVWRYGAVDITVDADGLRVGRAHLEPRHIGEVTVLNRAAYRHTLGPGADVRAHMMTRPYIDHGITVVVDDPTDPAPYWLISSRHPEALAAALAPTTSNGDAPRGQEA
ncbi:DUF3093 domain-containing protein [Aeromicrobium sp. UC242_57]|uniref:DUF3093 domain-containing protein n=1 Tax=Aeromicrobium sp. UC242_57 TaxID=3374624 RepID=UPI00379AC6AF